MSEVGGQQQEKQDNRGKECFIQEEYLIPKPEPPPAEPPTKSESESDKVENNDGGDKEGKSSKDEKKRGCNKKRPVYKVDPKSQLCNAYRTLAPGETANCKFQNCKYLHDVKTYMDNKPEDIGPECFVYKSLGMCPQGLTCRFARHHLNDELNNLVNSDIYSGSPQEKNHLKKDIARSLYKKQYDFKKADAICDASFKIYNQQKEANQQDNNGAASESNGKITDSANSQEDKENEVHDCQKETAVNGKSESQTDNEAPKEPALKKLKVEGDDVRIGSAPMEDLFPLKQEEKKKLDWKDKTYLAPLTTVGNLPFRRLCKKLGADITCGEMALGLPLLQGHGPEWALVQRHESEDFFGIQVCGCSPPQMSRVAQLVEETIDCDFVDINLGCPIDLIYKRGMGSGLMTRKRPLEVMTRTMASILTRPLTIKMRTGVYKDANFAHELFPKLESLGVSALTIHGRSREQRYTKLADWEYIKECRNTVDIPVFGNGDVLNYEDYYANKEMSGVDGIMLARGALIKPWLFTEIKERRHWDISGQERLDIVKDFANFGLEHWGSDDRGVETTRKFLLEWLSFGYRYVPHGILKYPPQRINERIPQAYRGRNELETLLSSPNGQDWVKITEMFLGKVKDNFEFLPKHKANSYS